MWLILSPREVKGGARRGRTDWVGLSQAPCLHPPGGRGRGVGACQGPDSRQATEPESNMKGALRFQLDKSPSRSKMYKNVGLENGASHEKRGRSTRWSQEKWRQPVPTHQPRAGPGHQGWAGPPGLGRATGAFTLQQRWEAQTDATCTVQARGQGQGRGRAAHGRVAGWCKAVLSRQLGEEGFIQARAHGL